MAKNFDEIVNYFKKLKVKINDFSNLIDIRDKVIRHIFKIMSGDFDIKP
ncbi:MAG: hypothetical protein F6J89_14385 [Symploca sp. SIO1C4]|uniref:Uncharacterized protein n=1 Tax=Symploca sp. SIO1C4 TaxID=2607765 RepID=A0A6B3NB85_9CYAN|nr:hypothetical protein [Symploca sp. SIO1C4]